MNKTSVYESLLYLIVWKLGSFMMFSSVISCPAIISRRICSGTLRAVNFDSAIKRSLAETTLGHTLNFCIILQPCFLHQAKGGVEGSTELCSVDK